MALVAKPSRISTETYVGAAHIDRKVKWIDNRHSSVPRYSQPTPVRSRNAESWRIYAGPGAAAHSQFHCWQNPYVASWGWQTRMNQAKAASTNKAYAQFKDAVGMTAGVGQNLAERKQAVSMIADRAIALRLGYLDLRKGRLDDFLRRFRLREQRNSRRHRWTRPKDASKWWLEYHFGWSPLLQDIHDASKILEAPFNYAKPVMGRGVGTDRYEDPYDQFGGGIKATFKAKTHIQATFSVVNPNLHRATQLGLTNPAALAWELVPFSFVVDWFIPVGNFLNSWSDFMGLEFSNPFTSTLQSLEGVYHQYMKGTPNSSSMLAGFSAAIFTRSLAIATPVVYPKGFKGFSVTRGATAIALLVQTLKS